MFLTGTKRIPLGVQSRGEGDQSREHGAAEFSGNFPNYVTPKLSGTFLSKHIFIIKNELWKKIMKFVDFEIKNDVLGILLWKWNALCKKPRGCFDLLKYDCTTFFCVLTEKVGLGFQRVSNNLSFFRFMKALANISKLLKSSVSKISTQLSKKWSFPRSLKINPIWMHSSTTLTCVHTQAQKCPAMTRPICNLSKSGTEHIELRYVSQRNHNLVATNPKKSTETRNEKHPISWNLNLFRMKMPTQTIKKC